MGSTFGVNHACVRLADDDLSRRSLGTNGMTEIGSPHRHRARAQNVRRDTEGPELILAPAREPTFRIVHQRAGMAGARRDRERPRKRPIPVRGDHFDRRRARAHAAIADLPMVIVAPAPNGVVAPQHARVVAPEGEGLGSAHRLPAGCRDDDDGVGAVRGSAVTQLCVDAVAPAPDGRVQKARARVVIADRELLHLGQGLALIVDHGRGRGSVLVSPIAELAAVVEPPAQHRPFHRQNARVELSSRYLSDGGQWCSVSRENARWPERWAAGDAGADLAPIVVAPAVDRTVTEHGAAVGDPRVERDDVGEARPVLMPYNDECLAALRRAVPHLAVVVAAGAPDVPRVRPRTGVPLAAGHIHQALHGGHRARFDHCAWNE
jgi:hypothetical protein